MRYIIAAFAILTAACASTSDAPSPPAALVSPQTITLTGAVTRDDWQSYLELPFTVPPGVARLTLNLAYEHKGDGVTLDIGLRDPDGQRGWSGSNKSDVVLSAWQATPSYRAGPIVAGTWTLILGVPNVREGRTANYTATIELDNELTVADFPEIAPPYARFPDAGFFARGDFHTHTGHSDGSCAAPGDERTPCPTAVTVAAARAAGLDFVAVTDHNTLSQLSDLAALEGISPNVTLIPGIEVTTFEGHANAIGLLEPLDFQLGTGRLTDFDALLDEADRRGALISVNHPALPTGERCMGCGWSAETDWSRIEAMEVVNGGLLREGNEEGAFSGIAFWETLLDQGYRITAIGGSDNHDPLDMSGAQSPVGAPTTAVRTRTRGVADILDGVRSGNVFIDMQPGQTRTIGMAFTQGDRAVTTGGELRLAAGESITGSLICVDAEGLRIEIVAHNLDAAISGDVVPADLASQLNNFTIRGNGGTGWVRANLRDAITGKLLVLGNPVYVVPAD